MQQEATYVTVTAEATELEGDLEVPQGARGLVLFAHGTGSSRHSPRNQRIARALHARGIATLLVDLLTAEEDREASELGFNIAFLGDRFAAATDWLKTSDATRELSVGYFGASTGAAVALMAAANRPEVVRAVVSRGGRPDLAADILPLVRAPTLFIVGSQDLPVLAINREAVARLRVETDLQIVQGASHLFEEPGTLDKVAALSADWFLRHLG